MLRVCSVSLLLVAITSMGQAQDPPDDNKPTPDDKKAIQGKWQLTKAEYAGKASKVDKDAYWTFSDTHLIYGGSGTKDSYTLDPAKSPRQFQATQIRTEPDRKDEDGVMLLGIYELDGDTLRICVSVPGKARPTNFESNAETRYRSFVLKRIVEDNDR